MHWACPLPQSAAQTDLWTLSARHALFAVVRQVTSSAAASVHVGKQQDAAEQAVDASDAAVSTYGLVVSLARGDGSAVPIVPNTHSIPFANPYFEGKALLILRTDSQQKYAHVFCDSRKNTQMVLQVQGKFKTVPQGRFYVGAEIPEQPKFSWLLKSFWKTVVAFARPVLPALHYSFGNSKFNELTHFMTPLYSSCDQVVITPPGETPPKLGEVFPETMEERAHRKRQSRVPFNVNTEDTYTFSVKCDYVDLLAWTLVRIPFAHQTPLHSILGTKHLRVCAYAVDDTATKRKHHSQEDIQRVFQVDFHHS